MKMKEYPELTNSRPIFKVIPEELNEVSGENAF